MKPSPQSHKISFTSEIRDIKLSGSFESNPILSFMQFTLLEFSFCWLLWIPLGPATAIYNIIYHYTIMS